MFLCESILIVQLTTDNDYVMVHVVLKKLIEISEVYLCIQSPVAYLVVLPRGVGLTIALCLGR